MDQEGDNDVHQPELGPVPPADDGDASVSGLDETRGIDLSGLLGGLLGNAAGAPGEQASPPGEASGGLSSLLGALLGGGDQFDVGALAGEEGLAASSLQAVVPLIMNALLGQGEGAGGASKAALDDLARGKAGAADALAGTGLLQEVMKRTGLNRSGALVVIMAVLKALGLGKPTTGTKPKPKPSAASKPKPKPKPKSGASAAAKPKPKPKPAAHSATSAKPKPKPKPKPAAHSAGAKPKPKPKPKPKRSGEIGEGGASPSADSTG